MEETIFDYGITAFELKSIFTKYKTKEEYLMHTTTKRRMHDLFVLFLMREDTFRAGEIRKVIFKNKGKEVAVNY